MSWFGWGKKEESPESAQEARTRNTIRNSPAQPRAGFQPTPPPRPQVPQSAPAPQFGADDLFSGMDLMTSSDAPVAPSPAGASPGESNAEHALAAHSSNTGAAGEAGDDQGEDDGSAFGFLASDDDEASESEPQPQQQTGSVDTAVNYGTGFDAHQHNAGLIDSTHNVLIPNPEVKMSEDDSLSLFADMNEVQQTLPAPSAVTPSSMQSHEGELSETAINSGNVQNVVDSTVEKLSTSLNTVIDSIFESVQSALAERSKLAQLTEALEQAEAAIREAQEEQERAAEQDEFERADALNTVIESLKSRAETIRNERSQYESHLEHKAETARMYGDGQSFSSEAAEGEGAQFLSLSDIPLDTFNAKFAFAAQLRDKVSDVFSHEQRMQKEDIEDERRALEAKLKKEVDSVKIDHAHAKNAIHHLDEELASIEAEMSKIRQDEADETAEEVTLQSKLTCECMGLEEEVKELERLLANKQRELRSKVDELEECGQRISTIRSSFDRRARKASDRKEQIEVEQKDAQATLKSLQARSEQCLETQIGIAVRDLSLELDRRRNERIETATTSQLMRLQTIASELNRSGAKFRILASQAMGSRGSAWKELENRLEAIDTEMSNLQIKEAEHEALIATANLRIPVLNAEKKTAAASKNFKAAAALNKEISALNDEKSASEEELGRLSEARDTLQKERSAVLEGLEEMGVKIREQESKRDLGIAVHYLDAAKSIYSLKYEVDKSLCSFKHLALKDAERIMRCKQGETVPSLDLPDFTRESEASIDAENRKSVEMELSVADQKVIGTLELESSRLQSLALAHIQEARKLKQRYEDWSLDVDVKEVEIDEDVIIKELEEQDAVVKTEEENDQELAKDEDNGNGDDTSQIETSTVAQEEDRKEIVVATESEVEVEEVVSEAAERTTDGTTNVDKRVTESEADAEVNTEDPPAEEQIPEASVEVLTQSKENVEEEDREDQNDPKEVEDAEEEDDIMASFLEAAEKDEEEGDATEEKVAEETEVTNGDSSPAIDPEVRKEELNQRLYTLQQEAKECEEEIERLGSQVADASNAEDYEQAEILNDKQTEKESRLQEVKEEIESCLKELQEL